MNIRYNVGFPEDYKPNTRCYKNKSSYENQIVEGFLESQYETMCIDYSDETVKTCDEMELIVKRFRSCVKSFNHPVLVCYRGKVVYFKKMRCNK